MSAPQTESGGSWELPSVPFLRVVAGRPTDAELAAVVTVFAALTRQPPSGRSAQPVSTAWNSPARRMRPVVRPGARAWRRAALPH